MRLTSMIMFHIADGLWELAELFDQLEIDEMPEDAYEDFYEAEYEDQHYESLDKNVVQEVQQDGIPSKPQDDGYGNTTNS